MHSTDNVVETLRALNCSNDFASPVQKLLRHGTTVSSDPKKSKALVHGTDRMGVASGKTFVLAGLTRPR